MLSPNNYPRKTECLDKKCSRLELYHLMTEQHDIGLMVGTKGEYRSLNPVMDGFIEQCGKAIFLPEEEKSQQVEFVSDTGKIRHFDLSVTHLSNGENLLVVVEVTNAVEQKQHSNRLLEEARHNANYDQLTGLANRTCLLQTARQTILESKRDLSRMAVFALDVDNFKSINDTFGHDTGDKVLSHFASQLKQFCRDSDFIARLGGDEFCIIQRNVRLLDDVTALAKKLVEGLQQSFAIPHGNILLTSSIGIALFPGDGADIETLLLHADKALYEAKKAGRNCFRIYSKKLNQQAIQKAALITGLYSAFSRDEFHLCYQPSFTIDSGQIKGAEAFIRWRPQKTPWARHLQGKGDMDIHCETFLPLLEKMGKGATIFEWVTQTACSDLDRWRQIEGYQHLTLSLNCSLQQLKSGLVKETIEKNLDLHQLPHNAIFLEISEEIFNQQDEKIQTTLEDLRSSEITLVLEGFGCSEASPLLLRQWRPDCVKLNIKDLGKKDETFSSPQLLADLVTMARHLSGVPIHAGCVEQKEQLASLDKSGCKIAQGTLLSREMTAEEIVSFLQKKQTNPTA